MKFITLSNISLLLFGSAVAEPIVYMIRHGEKPADGSNGLSAEGEERAQCLTTVFGPSSSYNIGYILAEQPQSDGSRARPYETVEPLAEELGLTVDTSCNKTDEKCVKKAVEAYDGDGNILICWEHNELTLIAEKLGVLNAPDYPDNDFGQIWTLPYPWDTITDFTDENCPGLGQ